MGAPAGGGRRARSLASFPSHLRGEKILAFRGQGALGVRYVAEYLGTLRFILVSQGKAFPSDLRASGAYLQPH